MSGTTAKPTPDNATVAWNELAERADALITAWQGENLPPDLAQFPPAEPLHLRRLVLVELIKIDLEYRWQHHELPKQVEEYVEEFPELAQDGEVPCDLIYEEFHIRRQIENPPKPEDYFSRFPKQSEQLRRMMKLEPNQMTTTSMVGTVRTADIDVGQQIDDFDLLVKLGKGSFGSVFLARQRSMQRLGGLENLARSRRRTANAGATGSSQHCARVRSARTGRSQAATDVHAAHSRRHAARGDRSCPPTSPRAAQRQNAAWRDR